MANKTYQYNGTSVTKEQLTELEQLYGVQTAARSELRHELLQGIAHDCLKLFATKNTEYGDAIAECGLLGAAVEVTGISGRLKQLVIKHGTQPYTPEEIEAIRDKLRDGVNYCLFGLMFLEEGNYVGR